MSDATALVARFFDAFREGRLDDLAAALGSSCRDGNPDPIQPPGRDGIVLKAALFHARYAGFVSRLDALSEEGGRVIADWTTTFADGPATRWRGRFTVTGERIAAFEVVRVA